MSDEQLPQFWSALDELVDPVMAAALRTNLLTGQQPGEVACMRREHIKSGWWETPGLPVEALGWPGTKNGKDRRTNQVRNHRVWLPAPVLAVINSLGDDEETEGFVFANSRGKSIGGAKMAKATRSPAEGMAATP